jgi:hypothetical protein
MLGLLAFILGFLGLLSMLKGWHLDATVYGEGPTYDHFSYGIPGYHDDGQIRQSRRRERERDRRAAESRVVGFQYSPLNSPIPHGILWMCPLLREALSHLPRGWGFLQRWTYFLATDSRQRPGMSSYTGSLWCNLLLS